MSCFVLLDMGFRLFAQKRIGIANSVGVLSLLPVGFWEFEYCFPLSLCFSFCFCSVINMDLLVASFVGLINSGS